jgi:Bacterial Ig domain
MPSRFSALVTAAKAGAAMLLMLSLVGVVVSVDVHPATAQTTGAAIANYAASQAGVAYCEGGGGINGPSSGTGCTAPTVGYDCMSLAQYAVYQATGITVPIDGEMLPGPNSTDWDGQGTYIPSSGGEAALEPGDVVFFGGSDLWHYAHSGIYTGDSSGDIWDALQTGTPVEEHTLANLTSLYGDYDGGVRYSGSPPLTTSVLAPATGTARKGTGAVLDASASEAGGSISAVQFVITGGSYNKTAIGTATLTGYGYVLVWNTTGVPNGSYTLQSLATDGSGNTAYSPGITVIVDNTPPTTTVLVPATGTALKGTAAVLDASAADNVSVSTTQFVITGGSYNKTAIGTATLTAYGYVLLWNTTGVPNGSYTLQSLATDEAGNSTYSTGKTITVDNTPPTTSVLVPATGTTLNGTAAVLDASAADNVSVSTVQFVVTGGSYNKTAIGTATLTAYGYVLVWNTTGVPNGSYTLQSLASDEAGNTTYSAGITVKVKN